MCGIFGYTGSRPAIPILLQGLTALEYRGYDSAGVAVTPTTEFGQFKVVRAAGKLASLRGQLATDTPQGFSGVGHTRWATHGAATKTNAHPHSSQSGRVVTVQNGIVENYSELRSELLAKGFTFTSETDAECIPQLIEMYTSQGMDLVDALRETATRLRGANAIVAMSLDEPGRLVALRLGHAGGLLVGLGDKEVVVASDLAAILPHTRSIFHLEERQIAIVTNDGASFMDLQGAEILKEPSIALSDPSSAAKDNYEHFMLKEINEQPEAIIDALRGRVEFDGRRLDLKEIPFSDKELMSVRKVVLLGMGTSLHAAMVGRMWIEGLAKIPAEVDNSSEFRYRDSIIDEHTLVISISQSGETADTLAAIEKARFRGAKQITLSNHDGAQTTRIADGTLLMRAGREVGVAATKTFTCSLAVLYMLALHLSRVRGVADERLIEGLIDDLARLPQLFGEVLARQDKFSDLASDYAKYGNFLYVGRELNFPIAMEGALKLKEVSYIHAEGYAAGEMKHGPISLIDDQMPVVALIPSGKLFEKMLSSINLVRARGGRVLAVTTDDTSGLGAAADDLIMIPATPTLLTPILMALPLQLLAYHIAVKRGCDVDQPRNLAKSVTVE